MDQNWQQLSEQILTDIKAWRRAHPTATLREIEHARGKQTRRLQAAGGQEISLTRKYGTCPTCGTGLFPPQ